MINIYNRYTQLHKESKSKIYFLGLNRHFATIKKYELVYVTFDVPYFHLSGFYHSTSFAKKLYFENRKDEKEYPRYIDKISPSSHYYTNIKIIEDNYNPELNNQVLLLKLGINSYDEITKYFKFDYVYYMETEKVYHSGHPFIKYKFYPDEKEKIAVKEITDQEIPINFNYGVFSEDFYNGLVNRRSLNKKLKEIKNIV